MPLQLIAGEAQLTWTHPTQYEDGTAVPAGTLVRTSLIYGICNATSNGLLATPAPVTVTVPYPATTHTITGLGNGKWCFAARSETATEQSVWTGYVWKDVILKPKPPSGLTVVATTGFMAIRRENSYVMLPIGQVPAGTPCDSNNGVIANGVSYFAVPASSVQWYGATESTVVLASCS